MTKVTAQMSVSLDGYYAGPRSPAGPHDFSAFIAPVLLGDGMRLFDASLGLDTREGIELTPVRVIQTPAATHIRYTIGPRVKLELDDRGAGSG